ncbi:hypothetical protein B0H34DRAFT_703400 [Crassisporium funariophilum]|nr:hypothetical protein B0H34DRAFT_703400 [Crassisporium funariophilum]
MGRALFSQSYYPTPAVRTEPEPTLDICGRWSSYNRFDPDSEDFFQDAEYEAFIDPVQYQREQQEMAATAAAEAAAESSDSSEGTVSDTGSPMAVGSDDPATLIADAYTNRISAPWGISGPTSSAEPEWQPPIFPTANATYDSLPLLFRRAEFDSEVAQLPAFIPPPSFRAPTPGNDVDMDRPASPPRSLTLRRTVDITPINTSRIQIEPASRSPSPDSPEPVTPSTLPVHTMYQPRPQTQSMAAALTPSPPPSVTPRFYSWQRHSIPAIPSSPTLVRGNRDGPLTNPRARMSFARIDPSPARIRIANTAI